MYKRVLVLCLVFVLMVGCSQSFYMQGKKYLGKEQYNQAIDAFYKELQVNPKSADAWRELGVTFYKQGNLVKAEDALKQAINIKQDSRSHMYLGLIYEKQGMWEQALQAYGTSLSLKPRGKAATMTRAHIDRLQTKKIKSEIAKALENESSISIDTIPENTIAVSNFDGSLLPEDKAPIAYGLSEFIAGDLSKVRSLKVIERQKIDVIMDELKLSSSKAVDPSTAPRMGKLLGTRHLVTGSVVGLGEDGIRVDGAIVNTKDGAMVRNKAAEGKLQSIFKLEKDIVFAIIDSLGITLTPEERDAIEKVPTESYLAFLAYCRGLQYKRDGYFPAAQQEFNNALELDPGFTDAGTQLQASIDIQQSGASYSESLRNFETFALSEDIGDLGNLDLSGMGIEVRINTILNNSGVLPFGTTGRLADHPPEAGTGTVVVRGDLDGQ